MTVAARIGRTRKIVSGSFWVYHGVSEPIAGQSCCDRQWPLGPEDPAIVHTSAVLISERSNSCHTGSQHLPISPCHRKLLYFKDVDQETLQKLIAAMEASHRMHGHRGVDVLDTEKRNSGPFWLKALSILFKLAGGAPAPRRVLACSHPNRHPKVAELQHCSADWHSHKFCTTWQTVSGWISLPRSSEGDSCLPCQSK